MRQRRERIKAVLKVRELQEQQAAMEVARAVQAARGAEAHLSSLLQRYDAEVGLDLFTGDADVALRRRQQREFHAGAIVHGKDALRAANLEVERQQVLLVEKSKAVRGLEKLDAGLGERMDEDIKRDLQRLTDDLTTSQHVRSTP